jgi:hypothetical protein
VAPGTSLGGMGGRQLSSGLQTKALWLQPVGVLAEERAPREGTHVSLATGGHVRREIHLHPRGPKLHRTPTPQRPPSMDDQAHPRVAQESQVDNGGCRQQHQQEDCPRQEQVEQEPSKSMARMLQGPEASGG